MVSDQWTETESRPYFVLVILNFKSKDLLSKGVKRLVPKLRNGQICLHWRKNTGFGQLQIQIWLPGGKPPGSTPFMLSCYWPEHNSEVQSCYCHSWTHCCCLSFALEKCCYHQPESLHACHLRPPYHELPSQQPTYTWCFGDLWNETTRDVSCFLKMSCHISIICQL